MPFPSFIVFEGPKHELLLLAEVLLLTFLSNFRM